MEDNDKKSRQHCYALIVTPVGAIKRKLVSSELPPPKRIHICSGCKSVDTRLVKHWTGHGTWKQHICYDCIPKRYCNGSARPGFFIDERYVAAIRFLAFARMICLSGHG